MSGPKSSRYTLTPEQRRILAEQRKIEHRKAVASESIKINNKRLLRIGSMFSSEKQISAEMLKRIGDDGRFAKRIKELESLILPLSSIIEKADGSDVNSLEETSKKLEKCVVQADKIVKEVSKIAAENATNLKSNLSEAIDQGFTTSFADVKTAAHTSIIESKEIIYTQLLQMNNNDNLPAEIKFQLENAINGLDNMQDEVFLKNYSVLTVSPLLKQCKQYLGEYESCHNEFESLYSEYVAICTLYYYVPQEYLCSAASIEELKSEINRIKETAAEDDEQTYISDCLDAVMEEMGYSVLGSRDVSKKNGKHFRNELYTYGEGTAVNVTYSSDGRIAMELGGVDETDRLPNEQEASVLCNSMEHFCDDFKEIEKRLFAKGVVLADRISLLPPNAEYAQIINTSDYEMSGETEKLQTKKHRRTATNQKTMKKE